MNKQEMDCQIVKDIIGEYIGLDNAITKDKIAGEYMRIVNHGIATRTIRTVIRKLRLAGVPILGNSNTGYCMPASEQEGYDCVEKEIYDRARSIMALKKPMKRGIRAWFRNGQGQLSLLEKVG